jgi:hypothetical protein
MTAGGGRRFKRRGAERQVKLNQPAGFLEMKVGPRRTHLRTWRHPSSRMLRSVGTAG